jgi:hypothetical protein
MLKEQKLVQSIKKNKVCSSVLLCDSFYLNGIFFPENVRLKFYKDILIMTGTESKIF